MDLASDSPEGVPFSCLRESNRANVFNGSEDYQATREPMHIFLGAMAQIERHLALRIGFSVSNEAEPCDPFWKSGHLNPSK